jgi:dephospho-CoA kinase
MLRVGLTGGYATGKTFVGRELEQLGCLLISADKLGHEVLEPGGEAYEPAHDAFGDAILNGDGTINRKKLGEIVFSSPEKLALLSGFVHPAVFHLENELMARYAEAKHDGIAVVEAAILIETGRFSTYERLIVTVCDSETQITRGMRRDHLTRDQVLERLAHQMPVEEKRKYADFVIDTSGEKAETIRATEAVYMELKSLVEQQR